MGESKATVVGAISAVLNPAAAVIAHTVFENLPDSVQWFAVVVTGLLAGMLEGIFIGRPWHKAIGIGTFIGTLVLWAPVVMVTYGFALLALPLLAAFAALVWLGAKAGSMLRTRAAAR